jgi:hypothetical protein
MRSASIALLCLATTLSVTAPARANSTCLSVLTADQLRELNVMVFPAYPYSAHLSEAVDDDAAQGAVRRLTKGDIEKLRGAIARPFTGPVSDVRSQDTPAALKAWLAADSSAELPAWDMTAAESDMPSAWVPRAWIGRTPDAFLHLMKEPGNAGPIKATTLGAATSRGHTLGVTQHTANDSTGRETFLWSYIYRATVNGRLLTTLLAVCQADVVTMSDDEQALRALEQELAHAWATRDRSTIERILAREWAVTTPDGATTRRAAVLGATFDTNARIVEAMTTDDDAVTVTRFDAAAVVRGRTAATVVLDGLRQTITVRFSDFFIKREGAWQIVASHQTSIVP